jgi:PAS domain S-box-containing protein
MLVAVVKETRSEAVVMSSTRKPRWAYESGWQAYAIAGLAVAAAILVRWFLDAVLGSNVPFITLFLAVVIAAWYGGTRPALAASAASLLLAWYLFIPTQTSFVIEHLSDAVSLVLFALVCTIISILGGRMRSAEQLARRNEALQKVTFASMGDAAIITDNAARVTGLNPIASALCGWSEQDALGRPLDEVLKLVNETTRQPVENPVNKVIAHGHIVGLANHTILIARNGSERPIDDSAAPIRDDHGQIIGVVMVFRDVTQRRAAEIALERLAAIVESSDDAIIGKDLNGVVTSWNKGAEQIFGYTRAEMVGRSVTVLIPSDRIGEEEEILAKLRQGGKIDHYETVRKTKDGRLIDMSISVSPLRDTSDEIVGASKIARDITSQKETELARRESHGRFTTFMQALPGLAWIKDLQGRYVFVNDAAADAFGQAREKLYGMTDDELFDAETADQFKAHDRQALANSHGIEVIESLTHEDGVHNSVVSKFPIPGSDGEAAFIGGVAIDITDRMRAEEALRQADRKKDEFLATLAHELRNPLAPIRNATKLLQDMHIDNDIVRAALDMLERQSRQMVRLIDDLLDVSRISRGKIELREERVELAIIVTQALDAARPFCDQMNHQLSVRLPTEPIYLTADSIRLAQVLGNLLNNACKFTPKGGAIRLSVERDNQDAVIRVSDNGIGIPSDKLPHIFDMFSQLDTSLERSQGGLGIGLSLVKSLVELHGGRVEARSEGIGRGSEFVVHLPIDDSQPVPVVSPSASVAPAQLSLRILVVDDNVDAATSMALLLKRLGHEVHLAHDGLQAVESSRALEPQIVLLDIGLPKLNGYDACRQIRAADPERKATLIALTGWGQPDDRRKSEESGFDAHLVKPVDLTTLMEVLRRFADK